MARSLTNGNPEQFHILNGHAYWASHSQNITMLVEAQTSLDEHTLVHVIADAERPENADKLFIACLVRISPAELYKFFTLPWPSLPPNFRLLGTMDINHFHWRDPEILLNTTILHWPKNLSLPVKCADTFSFDSQSKQSGSQLLQHSVRQVSLAFSRFIRLVDQPQPLQGLIEIVTLFQNNGIVLPSQAINLAVIFLANSWSGKGKGLFASLNKDNLAIVLDFAIAQNILHWINKGDIDPALFKQLDQALHGRYLHPSTVLRAANNFLSDATVQPNC